MTTTIENIPKTLGTLLSDLEKEGFEHHEAYQIILDLIRRGDSPQSLLG
jgi:hypothetical protein